MARSFDARLDLADGAPLQRRLDMRTWARFAYIQFIISRYQSTRFSIVYYSQMDNARDVAELWW